MSLPNGGYKSSEHEAEILKKWIESGSYKPEFNPETGSLMPIEEMKQDSREAWALICPPPNAYGRPHIGNISGYAYMDAMARYQRMNGKKVLVLPGKDHAGLEGEGVFVRDVLEKKKIRKFDIERDEFYSQMMDWMQSNMETAQKDEKEIGLSADFDRDTFTLDPEIVETVLDTFVEMYKDKKIYKGVRIINYDIKARTAVADNQIEYKDSETPFFYFKYIISEPVQEAIDLKNEFSGKGKHWIVKEAPEDKSYLLGEMQNGVKLIGVGYDQVPIENEVMGEIVGIQMRLDNQFRLIIKSNDFEGDLEEEITKVNKELFSNVAGSHILLFDKHSDDKSYTNGLIIGTVRPETIFADTAIACDPKDDRYKEFVGKEIEVVFLGEKKKLNFIEDHAVDKDFGTGLLKVTPAHSVEDWEIALRHPEECMPAIQVINYDLTMTEKAGKYAGMRIKEAREAMREDMIINGNLVYVDDHYENRIAIAERTKAPIEPLLSSQWYLKYDGMKEAAIEMVKNGDVTIHPKNMEAKFNYWMENLRDWAISRSLWWGYRLPVWYNGEVKEEIGPDGQVREMIKLSSTVSHPSTQGEESELIILVDAVKTIINSNENYELESYSLNKGLADYLEATGNRVVVVTNAGGENLAAIIELLKEYSFEIYSLENNPNKVEPKFFEKLSEDLRIDFSKTIYVDHKDENIESAKKAGVQKTLQSVTNNERIEFITENLDTSFRDGASYESWVELEYDNPEHLRVQKEKPGEGWKQDDNVLDTWFSSGQWVYATLQKYNLMDTFFPTDVMVSGFDILENWDSRMMMFTHFKHQQIPFKDLYLTGLVKGTDGQKMSKSRGNLINIDEVKEKYGTDAVRMVYYYQNSAGSDYSMTYEKLDTFKKFINKLWNASKFVMMNIEDLEDTNVYGIEEGSLKLENSKKLLQHINDTKNHISKNMESFDFGLATYNLYHAFWHDFCDIFLESSKPYVWTPRNTEGEDGHPHLQEESKISPDERKETQKVLLYGLKTYIKLLHPFMPFVTQRIWQELPKEDSDHEFTMYSKW